MGSFLISLVVVSITGQGVFADTQGGRLASWRIERDIRRFNAVATDNVMNLLAITPGMTILDIGAGTGQFSCEFARRLNGTGKVYATDTNESCIDYMKKEAAGRGLRNLHPVLVRKDGVDPFYGKQKYDLITVFHLSSMSYGDQADYFREMRGLLTEGGRLILILYKIPAPFSSGDIKENFEGFLKELSLEPAESPFSMILKDSTRKRIRNLPGGEPSEDLRSAIVKGLNEVLSDNRFAARFFDGSVFRKEARFTPEERRYADWYLLPYPGISVRNRDTKVESVSGARTFETINKLLILQRYRKYFNQEGMFLSGFTPSIRAVFGKGGYRLEREVVDLIPFEDMIVFSTRSPGKRQIPKASSAP